LHWHLPNSARNLSEAEFGRIWEKWPNFEFAEAEIRCNPKNYPQVLISLMTFVVFYQSDMFSLVDATGSVNLPSEYQYLMLGMIHTFLKLFSASLI